MITALSRFSHCFTLLNSVLEIISYFSLVGNLQQSMLRWRCRRLIAFFFLTIRQPRPQCRIFAPGRQTVTVRPCLGIIGQNIFGFSGNQYRLTWNNRNHFGYGYLPWSLKHCIRITRSSPCRMWVSASNPLQNVVSWATDQWRVIAGWLVAHASHSTHLLYVRRRTSCTAPIPKHGQPKRSAILTTSSCQYNGRHS